MSSTSTSSGPFYRLTKLFYDISRVSSLTEKQQLVADYLDKQPNDTKLAIKLLMCKEDLRKYSLKDKKLITVAANAFDADYQAMRDHLDDGDVSETMSIFLKQTGNATKRSSLTLKNVDDFLERLTTLTKQRDQEDAFNEFFCGKVTTIDIKWIVRLIRKDLQIGIGAKYILQALHEDAYNAWKSTANLDLVIDRVLHGESSQMGVQPSSLEVLGDYALSDSDGDDDDRMVDTVVAQSSTNPQSSTTALPSVNPTVTKTVPVASSTNKENPSSPADDEDVLVEGSRKRKKTTQKTSDKNKRQKLQVAIQLFHPVKPMLAKATKTFDEVLKKCPTGFYADLKYDGERIQIHYSCTKADGKVTKTDIRYFSRNLKPVMEYKIQNIKEYISQSITCDSVILDGEILMVNTQTGEPLPFGSLGKHKRKEYGDDICEGIFLFDILYLDGKSLLHLPMKKRRRLLKRVVTTVENRVMVGETLLVDGKEDERETLLAERMSKMISNNYEGLVIKPVDSVYEPKARHWLKIKKDYLENMADTVDLCVVGGYWGTGSKSGLISVFLMATYDEDRDLFTSVCRVGNGWSDAVVQELSDYFTECMVNIQGDYQSLPSCVETDRTHTPDLVLVNPKQDGRVFEIAGAEFSKSSHHPQGISVRFPRCVRIRDDKSPTDATTLKELRHLFKESKKKSKINIVDAMKQQNLLSEDVISKRSSKKSKKVRVEDDDDDMIDEEDYVKPKSSHRQEVDPNIMFVSRDFVDPWGDGKKILLHCLDDGGEWKPSVPTCRLIDRVFGEKAKKKYESSFVNDEDNNLGSTQLIKVKKRYLTDPSASIYVCNMIVQKKSGKGIPHLDMNALETCFKEIGDLASQHQLSVHMNKIYYKIINASKTSWRQVETLLTKHITSKGVKVFIYTTAQHDHDTFKDRFIKTDSKSTGHVMDSGENQTSKTDSKSTDQDNMVDEDSVGEEKVLSDCVITIDTCFDEKARDNLRRIATRFGATCLDEWDPIRSTHFISSENSNSDQFSHVAMLGGLCVSRLWLDDCAISGYRMNHDPYLIQGIEQKEHPQSQELSTQPLFEGLVFYLSTPDLKLKREIILNFGDVTDLPNSPHITHIISDSLPPSNTSSVVCPKYWVLDCIKAGKLLPIPTEQTQEVTF